MCWAIIMRAFTRLEKYYFNCISISRSFAFPTQHRTLHAPHSTPPFNQQRSNKLFGKPFGQWSERCVYNNHHPLNTCHPLSASHHLEPPISSWSHTIWAYYAAQGTMLTSCHILAGPVSPLHVVGLYWFIIVPLIAIFVAYYTKPIQPRSVPFMWLEYGIDYYIQKSCNCQMMQTISGG